MKRWLAALAFISFSAHATDWVIAVPDGRAEAGGRFELIVVAPANQTPPDTLMLRLRADVTEVPITVIATAPGADSRRGYAGTMPPSAVGAVTLQLADRASNLLVVMVTRRDAVQTLTGRPPDEREPPLSEEEPMYFVMGTRGGVTARFQLSFKYRLFDTFAGYGHDKPWLSGIYFGYTQNSLWDLETESRAFRDTSYRPSFFWRWQRTDERTFLDGVRAGIEHESNGGAGEVSRSINILFVRPEWVWRLPEGASFEFTPKVYNYIEKSDNTDIDDYRGHVDWRLRYDSGGNWIATGVVRYGAENRASILLDLSRRTRDVKFGPVSGYLHLQFFAGYGESILDYNVKRKSQLRFGFAIVP
jgi:phospholipase A1